MRVSYSAGYYAPIPKEHIFPMGKFAGLHRFLLDTAVITEKDVVEPSLVDFAHLLSLHTSRYATGIWEGSLSKKEIRRLGLPWSKKLAIRSRLAVQGTINAALMALQDGIAGNLAGGTHHAMPDHGEGFCVFNDVAVAVKTLRHSKWVKHVLVLDCDVHQGNGTAYAFQHEPEVFTCSIHGEKNYPFVKPPSDLDVGLPDGTTDRKYKQALIDTLDRILVKFKPDLVFYLGGIDPLESDHFGRLSLTLNGLRERDRIVIETITGRKIPLVLLLSGGYGPTLRDTVVAHAQMYQVAKELGL